MSRFFPLLRWICACLALLAPPSALALDGKIALADLHHDIWTAKDGAPGEVSSMAQTTDGWLWIGSYSGLYRFDGLRFRRFEPLPGDTASRRPITSLTALRDGDLLIGYIDGGLSLLRKGHIQRYPSTVDGVTIGPVYAAVVDTDGALWIGSTTGLLRLRDGVWHNVNAETGLPPGNAINLMLDQYGQLWTASKEALYIYDRASRRFRPVIQGVLTVNLITSPDGRLWLDTHDKLIPVPPQHQGPLKPRPAWMQQGLGQESGLFDRDANYWSLICPVGICLSPGVGLRRGVEQRPNAAPRDRLDQPWQVSSLTANVLFEDDDGNIWVGTQTGLERFRQERLTMLKIQGGDRAYIFANNEDGQTWLLSRPSGTLWRTLPDGHLEWQETLKARDFGVIGSAADGALLIARPDAIERRFHGNSERIGYPAEALAAGSDFRVLRLIDDGVNLWLGVARRVTYVLRDGRWSNAEQLGIPPGGFVMVAGGGKGQIWVGYADGLMLHYDNGRITRYPGADNASLGALTYLHADGKEVVAGGDSGLAVFDGAHFRRLRASDPEPLLSVSGMVVGANGDRWLNANRGVVYIKAADWQAALASPDAMLEYTLYGAPDGYVGTANATHRLPTAIGDASGRVWFASSAGVARLDTRQPQPAQQPPRVKIETLVAQGRRYLAFPPVLELDPGTTSFRIEYTALSYAMPEALRFRYQLEGVDKEWQEPGSRRAVSYTNLGPGDYRFRVAAVNQLGQWSTREATLKLRILPTFRQTALFYSLCVLALLLVLYLLYLLWLRQTTIRIGERIAERERIARTLHDTFLQSVQGLVLGFQTALAGLPADSPARARMERVLLLADRVMEEGRDEVQDLRSSAMSDGDLHRGLALVGEVLQESHRSVFSLRQEGKPAALHSVVSCEVYSIGREALMNAFRHADAKSITVTLSYGADQFALRVADDGKGIAPEILESGQRPGHWGLPGMLERAVRAGGKLSITSDASGTRVTLTVPAAQAYIGKVGWKRRLAGLWLGR